MLTKTEQVWRHLLVGSLERGHSRYPSVSAVARGLDLGVSTVHRALQRPLEMDVIRVGSGRPLRVIDPHRLLLLWAGHRNLRADVVSERKVSLPAPEVERLLPATGFVLGGFGAIVAHRGGNFIAGYDRVVCYGDPADLPATVTKAAIGATTVMVLEPDPLLHRYGAVTPLAQAFVDLFNLPGWPASRFVSALTSEIMGAGVA